MECINSSVFRDVPGLCDTRSNFSACVTGKALCDGMLDLVVSDAVALCRIEGCWLSVDSIPEDLLASVRAAVAARCAAVAMIIAATIARANSLFFINSSLKSIFQLLLYIVLNRGRFLTC